MTAKIALFDLGNVVVDWEPARLYRQLMNTREEADCFFRDICTLAWHTNHDRGMAMDENIDALIAHHPDKADYIRAWKSGWLEMFHGYVDGVPAILDALRQKSTPMYALTNFPAEKWDETVAAFPYLGAFDDVIVSGVEKCVKPDPKIYEITLARMGNPSPRTVIFFDDRLDNVRAAQALGFQARQFIDAPTLKRDLEDVGLL